MEFDEDEFEAPQEVQVDSSPQAFHTLTTANALFRGRTLPSPRRSDWTKRSTRVNDDDLRRVLRRLTMSTTEVCGVTYYAVDTVESILSCYEAIVLSWKDKAVQRAEVLQVSRSALAETRDLLRSMTSQVTALQTTMARTVKESTAQFRVHYQRLAFHVQERMGRYALGFEGVPVADPPTLLTNRCEGVGDPSGYKEHNTAYSGGNIPPRENSDIKGGGGGTVPSMPSIKSLQCFGVYSASHVRGPITPRELVTQRTSHSVPRPDRPMTAPRSPVINPSRGK